MSDPRRADDHGRYRELLGAHVLGRLGDEEKAELERHLAGCANCRAEEVELREVAEAVAGIEKPITPPPGLEDRVVAAVLSDRRARERRARGRRTRPLGGWGDRVVAGLFAAAAILAIFVGVAFFATDRQGGPPGLGEEEPIAFSGAPEGVSADAAVVAHTWGTEVLLEVRGLPVGEAYAVGIERDDGGFVSAGTFVATGEEPVECELNGAVLRQNARAVAVTDASSGEAVMRSDLEPRPDLASSAPEDRANEARAT